MPSCLTDSTIRPYTIRDCEAENPLARIIAVVATVCLVIGIGLFYWWYRLSRLYKPRVTQMVNVNVEKNILIMNHFEHND